MKDEFDEDDELINKPFEVTEKKKLSDVTSELPNVIHKPYGYYEYSEMDESNNRFMRKQENTNSLRDTIFNNQDEQIDNKKNNKTGEQDLFDFENDEMPF